VYGSATYTKGGDNHMKISRGTTVRLAVLSLAAAGIAGGTAASAERDPDDTCHQVIATGQSLHCHQIHDLEPVVNGAVSAGVQIVYGVTGGITVTNPDYACHQVIITYRVTGQPLHCHLP
jgi:hypothetical protein